MLRRMNGHLSTKLHDVTSQDSNFHHVPENRTSEMHTNILGILSLLAVQLSALKTKLNQHRECSTWCVRNRHFGDEKLTVSELVKLSAYYGTRGFVTVFTKARHFPLFWASLVLSTLFHHILISILLVFFHLHLCFPRDVFPCATLLFHTRATCPAHFTRVYLIIQIVFGEDYESWSFFLCSCLQSVMTFSSLGPSIFLEHPHIVFL